MDVDTDGKICLFATTVSNAGVFAQMFNQLTQDKIIDKIKFTYEKKNQSEKNPVLWCASLHLSVISTEQTFLVFGPLCTSKQEAKRMVLVKSAYLLPHLSPKRRLTFKKRFIALLTNKGSVHLC